MTVIRTSSLCSKPIRGDRSSLRTPRLRPSTTARSVTRLLRLFQSRPRADGSTPTHRLPQLSNQRQPITHPVLVVTGNRRNLSPRIATVVTNSPFLTSHQASQRESRSSSCTKAVVKRSSTLRSALRATSTSPNQLRFAGSNLTCRSRPAPNVTTRRD